MLRVLQSGVAYGKASLLVRTGLHVAPRDLVLTLEKMDDGRILIDCLVVVQPDRVVATGQFRTKVVHVEPVNLILNTGSAQTTTAATQDELGGVDWRHRDRRLSESAWNDVERWLSETAPSIFVKVDEHLTPRPPMVWQPTRRSVMKRLEFEGIAAAVGTIGLTTVAQRRELLQSAEDPVLFDEGEKTVVERLRPGRKRLWEGDVIEGDGRHLPLPEHWRQVDNRQLSSRRVSTEFQNGRRRIVVVVAHGKELEELTGSDLIYYHSEYRSFCLVQYKLIEEADPAKVEDRSVTFAPEDRFWGQMARLSPFSGGGIGTEGSVPDEYRLTAEACFLKVCSRWQTEECTLAEGYYVPLGLLLSHVNHLVPSYRAPNRASISRSIPVSATAVGRTINNEYFTWLLRDGWIGTAGERTELASKQGDLGELIADRLCAGRQVVYAYAEGVGGRASAGIPRSVR